MTIRELHLLLMEAREAENRIWNLTDPCHENTFLNADEAGDIADILARMRKFIESIEVQ